MTGLQTAFRFVTVRQWNPSNEMTHGAMQFCSPSLPGKLTLFRSGGSLRPAQHAVQRQTAFCKLLTAPRAVWRVCGNSRLTASHRAANCSTDTEFKEGLVNWTAQTCCSTDPGLTQYRPVVTICTTSLTFRNPTFCPHSVFMCIVWISEQTALFPYTVLNDWFL